MSSISNAILKPPLTFCDCFTLGKIDFSEFLTYCRECDAFDENDESECFKSDEIFKDDERD